MTTYRTCHFCAFGECYSGQSASPQHGQGPEPGGVKCAITGICYDDFEVPSGCRLYAAPEGMDGDPRPLELIVWPVVRSVEVSHA